MKYSRTSHWFIRFLLACGCVWPLGLHAFTTPATKDLLLCFRQSGSSYDIVVNLGQVTQYRGLASGSQIVLNQFHSNQLAAAFSTLDSVKWSVFGSDFSGPQFPQHTLWMSRGRSSSGVPSDPWLRKPAFSQSSVETSTKGVGYYAALYSNQEVADPVMNTATVILEPSGQNNTYGIFATDQGNLKYFHGNIECTTPEDFSTTSGTAKCDLYELQPGGGSGTYLGCFELRPNGAMVFLAPGQEQLPGLTVVNNSAGATVDLSANATNTAVFTVSLSSPATSEVTVDYTTGEGTAKAAEDYIAQSGTLHFAPSGTNAQMVSVTVYRNTLTAYPKSFSLQLSHPVNATLVQTQAQCNLTYTAPPQSPRLKMGKSSGGLSLEFTAQAGVQYRLHYTNASGLGSSAATWPVTGALITGDGLLKTIPLTTTAAPNLFFLLQADR